MVSGVGVSSLRRFRVRERGGGFGWTNSTVVKTTSSKESPVGKATESAHPAFNLKDVNLRKINASPQRDTKLTKSDIKERINRLSQLLSNKTLSRGDFSIVLCSRLLIGLVDYEVNRELELQYSRGYTASLRGNVDFDHKTRHSNMREGNSAFPGVDSSCIINVEAIAEADGAKHDQKTGKGKSIKDLAECIVELRLIRRFIMKRQVDQRKLLQEDRTPMIKLVMLKILRQMSISIEVWLEVFNKMKQLKVYMEKKGKVQKSHLYS
uniref:Uncharacterized protein n=1 Tax=Chenopodium quinoa TaxID=63459 RepID=A0A803MIR5_CHEQI